MRFLRKKSSLVLGIDISSYSIEVMAITSERDVVAYERITLEEGIVQNGIIQKKDLLQVKLDQALAKIHARTGNLRGARAVVNIPDQQTYTRYVTVPVNLSGAELAAYVRKEAETMIPLEVEDMTATYVVLGKPQRSETSKQVLFAGTKKEVTRTILEVINAVDIHTIVLDMESTALVRSLLPSKNISGPVLILDGGSETSTMHIIEGNSLPIVSVAYPEGGVHATRRIAEQLRLSFEEAEKVKCAFGLLKAPHAMLEPDTSLPTSKNSKDTENNLPTGGVAEEVSLILHDWYQRIISDAQKMIAFYESNHQKRVSAIILSGGSALLPGVVSYLNALMGRPVRVGNPLIHLRNTEILGKEKPSILYATVVGLALRGIDPLAVGMDFTHGTIIETKKNFSVLWRRWKIFGLAILAVILAMAAVYGASLFFSSNAVYLYERPQN